MNYINNQTEEVCMAAVKQNGFTLQYVENQTEEICLAAVNQNGLALQLVKNQTEDICLAAVKQDGWALKYVNIDKFPDVYVYHKLLMKYHKRSSTKRKIRNIA